jgi:hypothetical protein
MLASTGQRGQGNFITATRGQRRQESQGQGCWGRTAGTGQPGLDRQDRTSGSGQDNHAGEPWKVTQDRTDGSRHLGQEYWDRSTETGWFGQDVLTSPYRTERTVRTWQLSSRAFANFLVKRNFYYSNCCFPRRSKSRFRFNCTWKRPPPSPPPLMFSTLIVIIFDIYCPWILLSLQHWLANLVLLPGLAVYSLFWKEDGRKFKINFKKKIKFSTSTLPWKVLSYLLIVP